MLGTYLTEKELMEVDDLQISDSELMEDLFPHLQSRDISSAYKSLKRIEGFEGCYHDAKNMNLNKLIQIVVKYPDFMIQEVISRFKTFLLLVRNRGEF